MSGRKIARYYQSPIDALLYDIAEKLSPMFKRYNLTPNHITTIANIVRGLSLVMFYKKHYKVSAVLYIIGYYFDCMDGYFARRYNMTTKFGDLYDHISDVVIHLILLWLLLRIKFRYKTNILTLLALLLIGAFTHMGCQEILYKKKSVLTILQKLCYNVKYIKYTRFLGLGTFIFVLACIIFNLNYLIGK